MSTLLTYDLTTDPDTLQVGYSNAKLTVIASNTGRLPVNVSQINITIPTGTGSAALCLTNAEITVSVPTGWVQSESSSSSGEFSFTPVGSGSVIGGLAFVFSGINVNTVVGTATIAISEGPTNDISGSTSLSVSKFPATFELDPLVASPASVAAGLSSVLSWDGSAGYNYSLTPVELLPGQIPSNRNSGSITTLPLTQNAVFTLTVTNGSGNDPFVTTRSVGVTVSPPKVDRFTLNGATAGVTCDMGVTLTFGWQVSNADHVLLMAGNTPVGFFPASLGEVAVTADRTSTYWIVAYFGSIQLGVHSPPSNGIEVTLNPPQILSFAATMPSVYADYDTTAMALTWSVKNATSLTLQLGKDQGEFAVPISTTSYPITPNVSTQGYTLTAIYDPAEVPASPIAAAISAPKLSLAAQSTPTKSSVSAQASVSVMPCPIDITLNTFKPGDTWTRNLPKPIAAMAWGIAGFNYSFADGSKHNLNVLNANATTRVSGQSFTMTPLLQLSNDSGNNISSSSTLSMMSFTVYQTDEGAGAGETAADWQNLNVTLSGANYSTVQAALASISLSSQTGTDGKISSISAKITSATATPDTAHNQTNVAVSGSVAASGEQNYYWGTQAGVLGRRNTPQGSGFAIKVVSQDTTTVDFDHPVQQAYTMLTQWIDNGTSADDNHTIKQLRSDYVTPSCNGTTRVTLTWGQAYWDDGKHDPWNASRQIILIAAYGASR